MSCANSRSDPSKCQDLLVSSGANVSRRAISTLLFHLASTLFLFTYPCSVRVSMKSVLVFDFGGQQAMAGWAGKHKPSHVFSGGVGRPRYKPVMIGAGCRQHQVGEQLDGSPLAGLLDITYPIQRGVVMNREDIELLVNHTLVYTLRADPNDHPCVVTEPLHCDPAQREWMAQFFIEQLKCQQLRFSPQANPRASFNPSGVVVEIGDGLLQLQAYRPPESQRIGPGLKIPVGGRDVTEHLLSHLSKSTELQQSHWEIVRVMKEKVCQASPDKDAGSSVEYELPDGSKVHVGAIRWEMYERRFFAGTNGSLLAMQEGGIAVNLAEVIANYVKELPVTDEERAAMTTITLIGGATLASGFADRLGVELGEYLPGSKVVADHHRMFLPWLAAAEVGSDSELFLSREEYDEEGNSALIRKFGTR